MKSYLRSEQEIMKNWKSEIPVVSVCCITYNQESYIEDAIKGFLIQETNFPFEIIIHDDASTDNTANIIREYEKLYPKLIKPIYQKENQYSRGGRILSRIVFPAAEGKYIALCEGDDYWTDKNKLQIQIDYMDKHQECNMTVHSCLLIDGKKNTLIKISRLSNVKEKYNLEDCIKGLGRIVATNSFVFRKTILDNRPEVATCSPCGDYVYPILSTLNGYVYYFDSAMCAYRVQAVNSLTSSWKKDPLKRKIYNEKYDIMLNKLNQYTNFAYADIIKTEHTRIWFAYYSSIKKRIILKKEPFKSYFKKMTISEKLPILLKFFIPILLKIYSFIRKKITLFCHVIKKRD